MDRIEPVEGDLQRLAYILPFQLLRELARPDRTGACHSPGPSRRLEMRHHPAMDDGGQR
jgi:hypothetical protein